MKAHFTNSEKFIENGILDWLAMNDIFAWKVKSVGTFDPVRKRFRSPAKRYLKGVSDILGIFQGLPLAIEVKSAKGRLTVQQKQFLERFRLSGGIAIVARSVADVQTSLHSLSPDAALNSPTVLANTL